jgi:hypothetical protein
MAFKEVNDLNPDTTISLGGVNKKTNKPNPKQVEGYYLGSRKVEDRKKKSGYSYIYVLQTPKGNLGVWGKTDLDRKMEAVTPGVMIRITQSGMAATPNGEMYKFKVEFDESNTIEVVSASSLSSADSGSATAEETDDASYPYDEAAPEYEDEEATQVAALAAAERQAKVKALLNRNKKA